MRLAPLVILCGLATSAGAYPDTSLIRRQIRVHLREIRACYEKALVKEPKLEGRVVATFTIGKTGAVTASKAEGLPAIDGCIAGVIRTIKFPPSPPSKGFINVSYPFVFQPR
ncbi:MAG: AgmX/PglI C-terminal domain-containing protein [Myxococcales bacterium]|nr:AgmX/PglI C-terminal domain-containing protein [Myxococcales bacterium]